MTDDLQTQPADIAAERQVLGACMVSNGSVLDDLPLDPDRFYRPAHQLVAEAILSQRERGVPCDVVTLTDTLRSRKTLTQAGGGPELFAINGECLSPHSAGHYWRIVSETWARRTVIEAAMAMHARAADAEIPPEQTVERARSSLDTLAERVHGASDAPLVGHGMDDVVDSLTRADTFTATGWADLDRLIGGWRPGSVTVVAARPGNGKSLFALNAAVNVSRDGYALMHSLEMTRREVQQRVLAGEAKVDLSTFGTGADLNEAQWEGVARARGRIDAMKLVIDERTSVTPADIHSRARSLIRRHGSLGLVVVDYIQLMQAPTRRKDASREQEVAAISRSLKIMAMDLKVPVIICAQLNRQAEQRQDGLPRVSDLRESGALEQDADCVILLHRDADPEKSAGELDVLVGKNRHGPTGPLKLAWRAHISRLDNLGWSPSRSVA